MAKSSFLTNFKNISFFNISYLLVMKLYHGILKENLKEMLKKGVSSGSYWGEAFEAIKYTDCDQIIEIESQDHLIEPNYTLIQYHENEQSEEFLLWANSSKTWEDSLKIFGSVLIQNKVFFNKEDIKIVKD